MTEPPPRRCDVCDTPLIPRMCKLVCLNCGARVDCSDV